MNKQAVLPILGILLLVTFVFWFHGQSTQLVINEVMASNGQTIADNDGEYEDWLELYNPTGRAINLEGYYLSDNADDPTKWQFPPVTIEPGGFLVVWASGKDKYESGQIHTNFSISAQGEPLILTRPDGRTRVDFLEPIAIPRDVSYGRYPDGSRNWYFYPRGTSTPGSSNREPLAEPKAPSFSHSGGFYQQQFALTLAVEESAAKIYYTLDGSVPDPILNSENTFLYSEPISIQDQTNNPNKIANIPTILEEIRHQWKKPPEHIFKGVVVRAIAANDLVSSPVATGTYFVSEQGPDRYSLPIFSLATNPANLFDHETGIYVGGKIFADYQTENRPARFQAMDPANYHQRGRAWERPINPGDSISLEFFDKNKNLAFAQDVGVRIHGGASRAEPQKTLRIYAREEYGASSINYPIFGRDREEPYKTLLLRNSGNEWGKTMFLDGYAQTLVEHFNVDSQKYRPSILFINGEYWGIHNIRERLDEFYLERKYGLDPNNVTILDNNAEISVGAARDVEHYHNMLAFIENNDISDPENYNYIETQMDIDNFIDYQIIQIFYGNIDWPHNNVSFWRYNTDNYQPEVPPGQDGRWRWMVFDLDSMGGTYGGGWWDTGERYPDYNAIKRATDPNFYAGEGAWPTFLFRSLLANDEFKNSFLNRFADHLNTSFKPEVTLQVLDELVGVIEREIDEHIERWGYPRSKEDWWQKVNYISNFMEKRPAYQMEHIIEHFNLPGTARLQLNTDPNRGTVKVNTIKISGDTPGVDNTHPWIGLYFQGVPIEITAIPKPGYRLVGWEGDYNGNGASFQVELNQDLNITAIFARE